MLIKVHNKTEITANGHRTNGNCKPVYCITTGMVYASVSDVAKDYGVREASVSYALAGNSRTCKGHRFCLLSKVTEHFEEITQCVTRINHKASCYDAILKKQQAKQKAYDALAQKQKAVAQLREKLNNEMALLAAAEAEVAKYKGE